MATSDEQAKRFNDDRRPALYASMAIFLVVNNVAVAVRCFSRYRAHHRMRKCIYLEDVFIIFSGLLVNAIVANLLASTHYGLGLHVYRIKQTDPQVAHNISNVFKHVWVSMVLFSPTFASIKLALLFFYRRVFLVNQKWLRIAWWANLAYIILWVTGSTGFYLFQCWPVQWYYIRYYQKVGLKTPDDMHGQCNATKVENVAMPLILSLISDVALLLLPIAAIMKLQIDMKRKLAIGGIFSIGILACLLGLARVVELEVDTDDKTDPSYGVVIFLILSAAEAVCAIVCASLPVVGPQLFNSYRASRGPQKQTPTSASSKLATASNLSKGFLKLSGDSGNLSDKAQNLPTKHGKGAFNAIPLSTVNVETPDRTSRPEGNKIVVKSEFHVTRAMEEGRHDTQRIGKAT